MVVSPRTVEKFWSRVDKTGDCWLWLGCLDPQTKYGRVNDGRKVHNTHKFAWVVSFGEVPNGLHVLHTCDVRHCVRPEHLYLGTNLDNIKDMVARDRQTVQSSLTREDAEKMRKLYQPGERGGLSQRALARMFGVNQTTVGKILRGEILRLNPKSSIITRCYSSSPGLRR
jgi:hypothetical protein